MALRDSVGGAHEQALENIDKFAISWSDFQGVLLARLNPQREDYLRHVEELVYLSQLNDPIILRSKPTITAVRSTNVGRLRNSEERKGGNQVPVSS